MENGTLRCWGTPLTTESLAFGGLRTNQVQVASVGACAVLQGGSLRCWGSGFPGPAQNYNAGGEVVAVSNGLNNNVCAVLANGSLRCWGGNRRGELGLGHTRAIPFDAPLTDSVVDVGGQVRKIALSVDGVTCAPMTNGSQRCWGVNGTYGGLGYRHTQDIGATQTPGQADGLGGSLDFGAGRSIIATYGARCALRDDRQLFCWDRHQYGENGNPTFFPNGTGARSPADVGAIQYQ